MRLLRGWGVGMLVVLLMAVGQALAGPLGYYREPAIHGDTIVFVAEGDLWKVGVDGSQAVRLTSHPAEESNPAISPDGKTIAYVGHYEGPGEVYTMPIDGGLPVRRTYAGGSITVVGWRRDGRILCSTSAESTLPDQRLITLNITRDDIAAISTDIPLAQAADGSYDDAGKTL